MRLPVLRLILLLAVLLPSLAYAGKLDDLSKQADEAFAANNYAEAMKNYLAMARFAEEGKQNDKLAKIYFSIGRCEYYMYDRPKAKQWYKKALLHAQKHQMTEDIGQAHYHLGAMYIEDENLDSGQYYAFKAIDFFQQQKNYAQLSRTYSTLVELYLNTTGNVQQIETALRNAKKYADLSQDKNMLGFVESKFYNYNFYFRKDYKAALEHVQRSEDLYRSTQNKELLLNAYRAKAECLVMLRDTNARYFMNRWFTFKDSILQAQKAVEIARHESSYESERRKSENKLLQKDLELSSYQLQSKNRTIAIIVILFVVVVLTGVWIYYRLLVKKKNRELELLQQLQKDRERIARDLHDNVGGQLSYINYAMDGILDEDETKRKELAASINNSVKSVVLSLRETIWAIGDDKINLQDFSDKLKVYARNLYRYTDVKLVFKEEILQNNEINPLVGLNLFRICQEVLTNAFKHSGASEINIVLSTKGNRSIITIGDNGKGFEKEKIKATGLGLENIRKRANDNGIAMECTTGHEKGTTYSFTI